MQRTSGKNRTAGFTLVESLVALVVLAVGMLGVAALYIEGLRAERTSVYHTTAVNLAADIADRIRGNRTAGVAYAAGAANNNCVNGGADCAPAVLAADDVFVWQQDVVAGLPGGTGNIAVAAGAPNTYTITVSWAEAGQAALVNYILDIQI
jgi:type IV pilus assembly protein PilV